MKCDVSSSRHASSVGWWRGTSLLLVLLVLTVGGSVVPSHAMPQTGVSSPQSSAAVAAAQAAEEAERTEDRSSNPVFNVLEFARVNDPSSLVPGPSPRIPPPQHSPAAAPPPGVLSDAPIASAPANPNPNPNSQQSPCVWAIISCCHGNAPATSNIRQQCFTTHNCHGAWFEDLCSEEFVRSTQEVLSQNVFGANVFGGAF